MKPHPLLAAVLAIACGLFAQAAQSAQAADYPSRPVRIIVPYPAGGAVDPPARILADQLSLQTGQQFIVENRVGAGGNIGTDAVVAAAPDGYTLLFSGPNVTIAPSLMKETTHFDPGRSFTPIAQVVTVPTVIAVRSDSSIRSVAALIEQAKARPGALTYGSPGGGSPSQLAMELLKVRAGIDILHVPYKGTAPAVVDLVGGQVDLLVSTLAGPIGQIRAGRVRGIAVTSLTAADELPDVPPVSRTLPGFELVTWLGVLGPRNMPAELTRRLAAEIAKAVADPGVARRLRESGTTPDFQGPAPMAEHIRREADLYGRLVRDANLKSE